MIKLVLKAKHGRWTQASNQLEVVEKKPLPVESIFKFKQPQRHTFFAAVNIYQVCVATYSILVRQCYSQTYYREIASS
jgi:hypothetical protein